MLDVLLVHPGGDEAESLAMALESYGYFVRRAADGVECMVAIRDREPSIVMMSLDTGDQIGAFDILRELDSCHPDVPGIVVSSTADEATAARALRSGAVDFIGLPAGDNIIAARVHAAIRTVERHRVASDVSARERGQAQFNFGTARIDPKRMKILSPDGEESDMTERELKLLKLISEADGAVVKRETIINALWGLGSFSASHSLDVLLSKLRRKLGAAERFLEGVYGMGYRKSANR